MWPKRPEGRSERYVEDFDEQYGKQKKQKCDNITLKLFSCYCLSTAIVLAIGVPSGFYLHSLYFDCPSDPPDMFGLIRLWDNQSFYSGYSVNYQCEGVTSDEIVLTAVCSYSNWTIAMDKSTFCDELRNKRECAEDPPAPTADHPYDWNSWSRRVGKKIRYMCNAAGDSPVLRVVTCGEKLTWEVEIESPENCKCGPPIIYGEPVTSNWDNKTVEIGTAVTFECNTVLGKKSFQTLVCATSAKWRVMESGACFFFISHLMNFTNAAEFCRELGTEMSLIENDGEQEEVKKLLEADPNYEAMCKSKVFLGFRENVNQQWETDDGHFVSGISELWAVNDEGREKCVVMVSPDFRFNNVLCQMQFCYVCEIRGSKSTGGLCAEGQTCYVLGSEKGDYRFSNNRCQGLRGQLARVVNIGIMNKIRGMISGNHQVANCKGFYVGIRSIKRSYERLDGQQITYQRFADDTARSMTRHCAVVDQFFRYDWMDETCSLNTCFMCKAIGYPLRALVPAGIKKELTESMKEIIAMEESSMKKRRKRNLRCPFGWAKLKNKCVLFNSDPATYDEAFNWCKSFSSTLAPANDSDLQTTLADVIRNFGDVNKRTFWHVGCCASCNCTGTSINSHCSYLDALLGTVYIDQCGLDKPFICYLDQ